MPAVRGVVAPPSGPLVICPECNAALPAETVEAHLRQRHQVYRFHGVPRPFNDTLVALFEALLNPRPDPEAWRILTDIAAEQHGSRATVFLTALLGPALARLPDDRRAAVTEALGGLVAADASPQLFATLASDAEPASRHLALAALGQLPPPLPPVLVPPLRGLLLDRRLPADTQAAALAAAIKTTGGNSPLTTELLRTFVSGLGKARSVDRLRDLEKRTGALPALTALCSALEDRLRMTCPRCAVEFRRPEMVRHLWEMHRLVLDGRRVRDPWSAIEDWLDEARTRPDRRLLERSRTLGQLADPEEGLRRVHRLMIVRGLANAETHQALLQDAGAAHAACCPWCYAFVPLPREVPPLPVNHRPGRLSAGGYSVEVSERGLRPRLEVRTPAGLLSRGPIPHRRLTVHGATLTLVGPLVVLALLAAFGVVGNRPPLVPVALLLLGALALSSLVRFLWGRPIPKSVTLACAWSRLAPRLHAREFVAEDSAFLAGLALLTLEEGQPTLGSGLLADLLKKTENALAGAGAAPGHLAALRRLWVAGEAANGQDVARLVVGQVGRCFEGRLPLAFAEHLLREGPSALWTRGSRARLRVLLCDRAFEAGFEVGNLLDAGQNAPALGSVLGCDDPRGLAALRLLWSLRPTQPWYHCGTAQLAFEAAADPARESLFARHPDLLLVQEDPAWRVTAREGEPGPAQILVCVSGVYLQEVPFTAPPAVVKMATKPGGGELVLGDERFRCTGDLEGLARRMERWFRYAFQDFLPQTDAVQGWQSPDRTAILRSWGAVPCPECRHFLLARVGQVGIALDETASTGKA